MCISWPHTSTTFIRTENITHKTKSSASGSQQNTHTHNRQTFKQTSSRETTGKAETRLEGMEQRKKKRQIACRIWQGVWNDKGGANKKRWRSGTVINTKGPQKLAIMWCSCGHSGDDSLNHFGYWNHWKHRLDYDIYVIWKRIVCIIIGITKTH